MFNFLQLKKSITGVAEQAQSLASEIEELKRAREALEEKPLSLDAYKKTWHAAIDKEASKWLSQFAHSIANDKSRFASQPSMPLLTAYGAYSDPAKINPGCLYFLFRAELKKGIDAALDASDWPDDCGPAPAEREQALATLDGRIESLEMQSRELVKAANAAGIDLTQSGLKPIDKRRRA